MLNTTGLTFAKLNPAIRGLRAPAVSALFAMALAACGGGGGESPDAASIQTPLAASPAVGALAASAPGTGSQAVIQAATPSTEVPLPADGAAAASDLAAVVQPVNVTPVVATAGATGRVFYIDSRAGSDSNNGGAAAKGTGSVGPWLTLAKLASAQLVAGDTVLLNCGSVWNETLRLASSGTAALPIAVRSNPAQCPVGTASPAIDGFARVPNAQWVRQSANLYKVQLPLQQLDNHKFDQGVGRWKWTSTAGDASLSVLSNCGPDGSACMRLVSGPATVGRSIAYSATFPIAAGANYRIKFDVKAPVGVFVRAFVRRGSTPYDIIGATVPHTGTGAWQSMSMAFQGLAQLDNARVDFDVPAGSHAVHVDNVYVEREILAPFAARLGTDPLVIAHHPNRGYASTEPTSPYLRTAADADNVATAGGNRGSTYVPYSDLKLPTGASVRVGTNIRIRTNAWQIDDRQITSIAGGKLFVNQPTSYLLRAGWGFFMTGDSWMLDEAGEWLYDAANSSVLVRTGTDLAPSTLLSLNTLDTCVDIASTQFVVVDGLDIQGCRTGVKATSTTSATLSRLRVLDVAGNGVLAGGSRSLQLLNSRFERAGEHAVLGKEGTMSMATGMTVSGNTVIDSAATRAADGRLVSLPVQSLGAVIPGEQVTVSDNTVSGSGYHGIRTFGNGLVKGNRVDNACLFLDDCGGIYIFGAAQGTRIEGNIVRDIPSGLDGKPAGSTSQGQGIFLDDHAHGVAVTGNTVSGAETGIFLHNAYNNTVTGNVLYANRKHQIWLMEDSNIVNAAGDVRGNVITDNLMFATNGGAAVGQESFVTQTSQFAAYDRNRYSALIANRVVSESWPTGSNSFQFAAWQQAFLSNGTARNQEPAGSVVNAIGYASIRVLGNSILTNGDITAGAQGWTPWNDSAPLATAVASNCSGASCLEVSAGATTSLVATAPFSVVAASWYRVTFDLQSNVAGMPVSVSVRRGGGGTNGYESLMGTAEMVNAPAATQRFSFMFKATKTVNAADPVTRDIGARLYFDRLTPGSKIFLTKVEVVPVTSADAALQTHLLSNTSAAVAFASCPDAATANAARCSQYVNFANGGTVTWPVQLAAGTSAVIYSRDTTLVDSDSDGIGDAQDQCPGTVQGVTTNAKGCSLGQ